MITKFCFVNTQFAKSENISSFEKMALCEYFSLKQLNLLHCENVYKISHIWYPFCKFWNIFKKYTKLWKFEYLKKNVILSKFKH